MDQERNNLNIGQQDLEFWTSRRSIAIKILSLGIPQEEEKYWSKQLFEAETRLADCNCYVPHQADPEVSQVFWNLYLDQST